MRQIDEIENEKSKKKSFKKFIYGMIFFVEF